MTRDKNATTLVGIPRSGEVSVEAFLATAIFVAIWWLLSDREPTKKEMTFAYRKYLVALSPDRGPQHLLDIATQPHVIELIKRRCYKLQDWKYRCEATVLVNDLALEERHAADNAIYTRDSKGWQFESITHD